MSITNRGKKWELRNSLWILWSFTLLFPCIGFFWIGGRTGARKWIVSGLVYLFLNFVLILIAENIFRYTYPVIYNIAVVPIYISWLVAIVHSFMVRKEYLVRYEAVLDLKEATRDQYRNELRKEYLAGNSSSDRHLSLKTNMENKSVKSDSSAQAQQTQKINLNTCSEKELERLPGVGVVHAKKAIVMRAENEFISVQDFCLKLNLMPHFSVQIENLAFVESAQEFDQKQKSPTNNVGRVIDI